MNPPMSGIHVAEDRKSTRLNSSHPSISYAVFCLKKKKNPLRHTLCLIFFLLLRPPPCSTLFPYTTLFRSLLGLSLRAKAEPPTGRRRPSLGSRFRPVPCEAPRGRPPAFEYESAHERDPRGR